MDSIKHEFVKKCLLEGFMDIVKNIEEIYELKNKHEMLMVYFGSTACGVCVAMKPKMEQMLEKYPNIKLVEVEAENNPELSAKYNVFTIPVIILYIQGKETIREARIISLEKLEQNISRYYGLLYND